MKTLRNFVSENGALVRLTFELFWVFVFLLDRIITGGGGGIPGFVYVNF